jgi:hypothetical protein
MPIQNGPLLNSVPAPNMQTLNTNYLDFTNSSGNDWAQQYLPDLMEKEAEVFGPRTISGFLEKVGAEESMTSDQVIWSEQGRLHISYTAQVTGATTIVLQSEIDGVQPVAAGSVDHAVRINDTIIVSNASEVVKCLVTNVVNNTLTVAPYSVAALTIVPGADTTTILVYGSEYIKGVAYNTATGASAESRGANEPRFQTFTNKPIILKDYYEVSGSDTSRIGWVEIASEEGKSGYLWYLKAEADTRARFNDYLEMSMIEGVFSAGLGNPGASPVMYGALSTNLTGTEGLFAAVESRGNLTTALDPANTPAVNLGEFDLILAEFDRQGAIEENMMFLNRESSLAVDDMLAAVNSYGGGGTSYGVFDNEEDMALNLGFSGFRRGSYDFYKSDFRYLNDKATRGGINDAAGANMAVRGIIIPAGTSTVYDQQLGKNLKRPFLHTRYRASQADNRKMKTWVTGSVGAATTALDVMQLHMLSERCLVTQGANNFMLLK